MPSKKRINEANKALLDNLLLIIPGVETGKMFGLYRYKTNGKMFALLWGNDVVIKVGEAAADTLIVQEEHINPFEPREGATWKEWVLLKRDRPEGFTSDEDIFLRAIEFVQA